MMDFDKAALTLATEIGLELDDEVLKELTLHIRVIYERGATDARAAMVEHLGGKHVR